MGVPQLIVVAAN